MSTNPRQLCKALIVNWAAVVLVQVMEAVSFDRNIVQYYGAWLEQGDAPFLVMEYMEVRSKSRRTIAPVND